MTSTPTDTTLTDRFVAEAVRRVPRTQRADLEAELRASIADAVDDRLEAGMDARTREDVEGAGEFVLMNVRGAVEPKQDLDVKPRVVIDHQFRLTKARLGLQRLPVFEQKIPD